MPGFRKSLASIGAVRTKLDALMGAARGAGPKVGWPAAGHVSEGAADLREIEGFGSNPGELRLLAHVPENLPPAPGLVVALHGCGQTAADYAHGTGWTTLADRHGFIVVFPEQRQSNNPQTCFTWFLSADTVRGGGEAASIQQMAEHAIVAFGVDRARVFVTGLSAGGAMASVMLATHPETYAGGAIIAGLPYGCAGSMQEAFEAMFQDRSHAPRALGDRVRAASAHRGPWPKVSVWHGSADAIVKPSNAEHIARQWADVHGLADAPARTALAGGHTHHAWHNANGDAVIEAYSLSGMAHGVPLDGSPHSERVGAQGAYFLDVGLCSSHRIARSWGLVPPSTAADETPAEGVAVSKLGPATPTPSEIIAAAFKSAGLPVPDLPKTGGGAASHIDPNAIIAAALKQAGFKR